VPRARVIIGFSSCPGPGGLQRARRMHQVQKDFHSTAGGRDPAHVSGPEWRGNTRLTQTQDGALTAAQQHSSPRAAAPRAPAPAHCVMDAIPWVSASHLMPQPCPQASQGFLVLFLGRPCYATSYQRRGRMYIHLAEEGLLSWLTPWCGIAGKHLTPAGPKSRIIPGGPHV
jgi:hypothetical protein